MNPRNLLLLAALCLSLQPVCAQQQYQYQGQYGGRYLGSPQGGGMTSNYNPAGGLRGGGVGASPTLYGQPGAVNGAYGSYYGGQYPYANQPGYGYYAANPYAPTYPALGTPVPVNGGLFRFNVGGFSGSYWKAPSGYYYPWGAGAVYSSPPPVIVVQQGSSQAAQPSITDMLKDMYSYVEDQNSKKKYKTDDYQHLARRIRDLQNLESTMRTRNGGVLDQNDEEKLRKDCAMLSGDMSRRVIP